MQRLFGLLLLIRGLTPILIPLLLAAVLFGLLTDLQRTLGRPLQTIQIELSQIEGIYQDAEAQWRVVQNDVSELTSQIETLRVPDLLPDLPAELTIPLNIPTASVPVPSGVDVRTEQVGVVEKVTEKVCESLGPFSSFCDDVTSEVTKQVQYPADLSIQTTGFAIELPSTDIAVPLGLLSEAVQPIEDLFDSMRNVFDLLDAVVVGFKELQAQTQKLPALLQVAAQSGEALLNLFFATLFNFGGWRAILLGLVALMVIASIIAAQFSDIRRGWRLLIAGREV